MRPITGLGCTLLFATTAFAFAQAGQAPVATAAPSIQGLALPAGSLTPTLPTPDLSKVTANPDPAALAVTVGPPVMLGVNDLVEDNTGWASPHPPKWGPDGKRYHLDVDTDHCPYGDRFLPLAGDFAQLQGLGKADGASGKHFWHKIMDKDYCHYRDGGRDWWGWRTDDDTFHWVLLRGPRFWWHDTYANRWLSFYNGHWWWQGAKGSVQVYLENGHYYLCGKDGTLGDDLWTTGVVESANKPVEKEVTPGEGDRDSKGLRHGGIGGSQTGL